METYGQGSPAGGAAAQREAPDAGTQDVAAQAQQMAGQVADQAQQQTGQVAEQIKQQASSRLSGQIDRAAEGLGNLSQTLLSLSGQLRQQDQALVAEYTSRTAEQVQRAASYLRGKDVDQLVDEAERFARRQPVVFVSGAFALGLVAARFLKSSGQRAGPDQAQAGIPASAGAAAPPPGAGNWPSRPGSHDQAPA
jgi:hypothetical protein